MGTILAKVIVIQVETTNHSCIGKRRELRRSLYIGPDQSGFGGTFHARRDLSRDHGRFGMKGAERAADRIDEALLDGMEDLRLDISESRGGGEGAQGCL